MSYKPKNTLNLIIYSILFLTVLLYTLIFLTTIGWILLSFLLVTFLCTLISLRLGRLSCLDVSLETFLLANRGDDVCIEITVQKKTSCIIFFPVLKIKIEELGLSTYLYGYTGKKKIVSIDWKASKRGNYNSLEVLLESNDIFYFFNDKLKSKITIDWKILPKLNGAISQILPWIEDRKKKKTIGEMSYEIKGYRSYTYGDSMKQVDWKLSTKHQDIMVKEFIQEDKKQLAFVFYPQQSLYFEKMLDNFFSLYKELEKETVLFYFVSNDDILKITDVVAFSEIKKNTSITLSSVLSLPHQTTILFIPELTKPIEKEINSFNNQGDIQVITYKELKKNGVIE